MPNIALQYYGFVIVIAFTFCNSCFASAQQTAEQTAPAIEVQDVDSEQFDRLEKWHGFDQGHFTIAGRAAYLVAPETAASGKPWVWRARFPNFHADMDIELLKQGFHVGYIDVGGLFGNEEAIAAGNDFYNHVTTNFDLNHRQYSKASAGADCSSTTGPHKTRSPSHASIATRRFVTFAAGPAAKARDSVPFRRGTRA